VKVNRSETAIFRKSRKSVKSGKTPFGLLTPSNQENTEKPGRTARNSVGKSGEKSVKVSGKERQKALLSSLF